MTGLTITTVSKATAELKQAGFIIDQGSRGKCKQFGLLLHSPSTAERCPNEHQFKEQCSSEHPNSAHLDTEQCSFGHPESDKNQRKEPRGAPNGAASSDRYAFDGAVIKLNYADFETWQRTYHALADLRAELQALDDWLRGQEARKQRQWFHVVSGALRKKHAEALRACKPVIPVLTEEQRKAREEFL